METNTQSIDSVSDTSCSTAINNTVQSVLHNDKIRYIRKGYLYF
jgi:hypothetical protein